MAKHQRCRSAPGRLLHRCPVGPQDQGQVAIPVSLSAVSVNGKLGGQGPVEVLHQTVALGVQEGDPGLLYPQVSAHLLRDLGLEVLPLVIEELLGNPKLAEHFLD